MNGKYLASYMTLTSLSLSHYTYNLSSLLLLQSFLLISPGGIQTLHIGIIIESHVIEGFAILLGRVV